MTTGILVCASSAHYPHLTRQAYQSGLPPAAWAKVNMLGELAPCPEPNRCNCWISINLKKGQKENWCQGSFRFQSPFIKFAQDKEG